MTSYPSPCAIPKPPMLANRSEAKRAGGTQCCPDRKSAKGPRVSVLMIAYNVEKYIEEALRSVLMQEVDFRYEIVIGEDCSTDNTRDILQEFARRHEDRIRLILRERNLGMNRNFFSTYAECEGKFIALLDGDDYWTSPQKLQKQVDFLERHPEYSVCFHNADVVYEDDSEPPHPFHMRTPDRRLSRAFPREVSTLEDIVGGNFMQTGAVVFRAGLIDHLPQWVYKMPTFDWPLHVLNAEKGLIRYIDEVMSVYRVHAVGMWSMNMSFFRNLEDVTHMLDAYKLLDHHFEGRYHALIHDRQRWLYEMAAQMLYSRRNFEEGNAYLREYLRGLPVHVRVRETKLLLRMLHARFPSLGKLLGWMRRA
jgi:glycosyltransferase involved in cell wall biosynthesis